MEPPIHLPETFPRIFSNEVNEQGMQYVLQHRISHVHRLGDNDKQRDTENDKTRVTSLPVLTSLQTTSDIAPYIRQLSTLARAQRRTPHKDIDKSRDDYEEYEEKLLCVCDDYQ